MIPVRPDRERGIGLLDTAFPSKSAIDEFLPGGEKNRGPEKGNARTSFSKLYTNREKLDLAFWGVFLER
jgi:hypothetical protein